MLGSRVSFLAFFSLLHVLEGLGILRVITEQFKLFSSLLSVCLVCLEWSGLDGCWYYIGGVEEGGTLGGLKFGLGSHDNNKETWERLFFSESNGRIESQVMDKLINAGRYLFNLPCKYIQVSLTKGR